MPTAPTPLATAAEGPKQQQKIGRGAEQILSDSPGVGSVSPISRIASNSPLTPPEKKKNRRVKSTRPSSPSRSPRRSRSRGGNRGKSGGHRTATTDAQTGSAKMTCWFGRDCGHVHCRFHHPDGRLLDEGGKPLSSGKGGFRGGKDGGKGNRWGKGGKGKRYDSSAGAKGSQIDRFSRKARNSRSRSRSESVADRRRSRKGRKQHRRRRSGRGRSSKSSRSSKRSKSSRSSRSSQNRRGGSGSKDRGSDAASDDQKVEDEQDPDPCCTFKSFVQQRLAPNVSPADALKLFEAHLESLRETSWPALQDTALAFDMYNPVAITRRYDWRIQATKLASEDFVKSLQMGNFAGISLVEPKGGQREGSRCLLPVGLEAPYFLEDPSQFTLFIDDLPRTVSVYKDIIDNLPTKTGDLRSFSIEKPTGKALLRSLRLVFRDENSLELAQTALKEQLDASCTVSRRERAEQVTGCVLPPNMGSPDRIVKDKDLAGRLIQKFDAASNVEASMTEAVLAAGAEDVAKALDLRVLYLRRVHHFCLYLGRRFDDTASLHAGATAAVLRSDPELLSGPGVAEEAAAAFERSHTDRLERWLNADFDEEAGLSRPPILPSLEDENLAARVTSLCEQRTEKVEEGKFKCLECNRMFKGPEYVSKHIRKVHMGLLEKVREEALLEISKCLYFEDASAPLLLDA